VANLQSAHLEGTASYKMRTYTGPSVLVVDELGDLPLDQASANWIFQMVSRRYDKASIVLTSNRGFGDWNQVFADPVVASAIVLVGGQISTGLGDQGRRFESCLPDGRAARVRGERSHGVFGGAR
jgi:hypothetical protein